MLKGQHRIAGTWVSGATAFLSVPAQGAPQPFANGTPADVGAAWPGARAAFASFAALPRPDRAGFLDRIAGEIEARGPEITAIAMAETALPAARLDGERARTTGPLRLFAAHLREGASLDRRTDPANRTASLPPAPRAAPLCRKPARAGARVTPEGRAPAR